MHFLLDKGYFMLAYRLIQNHPPILASCLDPVQQDHWTINIKVLKDELRGAAFEINRW
jgi:hypothetical protein